MFTKFDGNKQKTSKKTITWQKVKRHRRSTRL